jgi:hypothetical protein
MERLVQPSSDPLLDERAVGFQHRLVCPLSLPGPPNRSRDSGATTKDTATPNCAAVRQRSPPTKAATTRPRRSLEWRSAPQIPASSPNLHLEWTNRPLGDSPATQLSHELLAGRPHKHAIEWWHRHGAHGC